MGYNTGFAGRLTVTPPLRSDQVDEQRAELRARTRHDFVYLVRDGKLHEVGPAQKWEQTW